MTQKEAVLRHLRRHRGITTFTAFNRYAITRLSERCREIEGDGHTLARERVKKHGKFWIEYQLVA